jgi:hypothetical protein
LEEITMKLRELELKFPGKRHMDRSEEDELARKWKM